MNQTTIWHSLGIVCTELLFKLAGALLFFLVGRFLIRFLMKRFPSGSQRHPLDPTARQFFMNISRFVLYGALILGIVGILGVPLASVITVIGTAGAAIALALQGSLGNLASGMMLLVFKPIRLGDYVEADGASGTVTDLGVFYTTLVTPDHCHYTLPNSLLTTATIKNYTREKTRRLDFTLAFDPWADLTAIKRLLIDTVTARADVLSEPMPFVSMIELGTSAVSITVRVWCSTADYWNLKFSLTEQIQKVLAEKGITVSHPQLDVHIRS